MPTEISEILAHQANYKRSSSILSFISEESICLNGDDSSRPTTPGNKKKGSTRSMQGSSREFLHNGMNHTNSSSNREAAGKSSSSSPLTTEEMGSEDVALGTSCCSRCQESHIVVPLPSTLTSEYIIMFIASATTTLNLLLSFCYLTISLGIRHSNTQRVTPQDTPIDSGTGTVNQQLYSFTSTTCTLFLLQIYSFATTTSMKHIR